MGKTDCRIFLREALITNLDFSVIFAEKFEAFVNPLRTESELLALKVSWIKTKIQIFVALLDENIEQ